MLEARIEADAAEPGDDREDRPDEFNVEFKRQGALQDLRDRARDNYSLVSATDATT